MSATGSWLFAGWGSGSRAAAEVRRRLTLAFVLLALLLAGAAGVVQADALADMSRAAELNRLADNARIIGNVVEDLDAEGLPVSREWLATYAPSQTELVVARSGVETLTVRGVDFDGATTGDAPRVEETVGTTTVTLVQDPEVATELARPSQLSLLALVLATVTIAGLLGFVVAGALARPFHQLARSAGALGRGRFDFEPPRSTIPEVVSIAGSLATSATHLQESLRRDRDFFHHASHVLRTPLTSMRLELEELSLRGDLPDDARHTVDRCQGEVERIEATVSELLDFARSRTLVAGAGVSLLTLGSHVAQRWRDQLPESREVRAFVDAGPEFTLTPGPVEQLLDSVLRDVVDFSSGPVTLRFAGQEEHVRVTVRSGPGRRGVEQPTGALVAHTIAEVLGGRCTGDAIDSDLEILLPRR